MMGKVSGVAQIIEQGINHRSLVVHCFCHSLSLACSDTIKNGTLMKNSLNTSFEITNLVKFSPKRAPHLKEIIAEDMSTKFINKISEVLVKQDGQFTEYFYILQRAKEPVGLVFFRIWRT